MLNLADGFAGLARMAQGAFGGPYAAGSVVGQATPGGYDDAGVFVPGSPATNRPCLVQIDQATEAMRQAEGFADGDVRFIILASSLAGTLDTDAKVAVSDGPYGGTTWVVSGLQRDPVAIGWVGKGRRA